MASNTWNDIDEQIETLNKKIELLKKQRDQYLSESKEVQTARLLHAHFCLQNHTDGCSWEYEKDTDFINPKSYAKNRYYRAAQSVLKTMTYEELNAILNAHSEIRHHLNVL